MAFKNAADDEQARLRRSQITKTGNHEVTLREEWGTLRDRITALEREKQQHHKFSSQSKLIGKEIAEAAMRIREIKAAIGIGPTNEVKTMGRFFVLVAKEMLPPETFENIHNEAHARLVAEAHKRRDERED